MFFLANFVMWLSLKYYASLFAVSEFVRLSSLDITQKDSVKFKHDMTVHELIINNDH